MAPGFVQVWDFALVSNYQDSCTGPSGVSGLVSSLNYATSSAKYWLPLMI